MRNTIKIAILTLLALLFSLITLGLACGLIPSGMWVREQSTDLFVDNDGNCYLAGKYSGKIQFNLSTGIEQLESNGLADLYLSKIDVDGNLLWFQPGEYTSNWKSYSSVMADTSGNTYLTGSYQTAGYIVNAHLYKWDLNGNLLWSRNWGPAEGENLSITNNGEIYVVGITWAPVSVDFDPGPDEHILNMEKGDAYLSSFDSDGNFLGTTIWPSGLSVSPLYYSMDIDRDGNVYIFGENMPDHFISKFYKNGNLAWKRSWAVNTLSVMGVYIAIQSNGSIFLSGAFEGILNLDIDANQHTSNGENDVYLCKFDAVGNLLWFCTFGGTSDDFARGTATDNSGNLYVSGVFEGAVDFDPGPGINEQRSRGNQDIFLTKFDSQGNYIWTRTWGGEETDQSDAIAVDENGNIYVTGNFSDQVDFDPGEGINQHNSVGFNDIFLSRFNSEGTLQWVCTLGGINNPMED